MKAIALDKATGLDAVKVVDLPKKDHRELQKGEVRLGFLAGSLNHLDLWVVNGLGIVDYKFPHVLGSDFCGEVLESKSILFNGGEQVVLYPAEGSGLSPEGKPVPLNLSKDFGVRGETKPGVFQEDLVVSDRYVFHSPPHLSTQESAAMPLTFLTAWQMVVEKAALGESDLNRDKPILVHGAGSGVSIALLELLQSFGYTNLAISSRSEEKLSAWRSRNVHTILNTEGFETAVKAWARPAIIFDHIGQKTFEESLRVLRHGGLYITCGATSGFKVKLDLRQIFFRQLQVLGSTMGSLEAFRALIEWIRLKKLRPHISHQFKAEDAKEALKTLSVANQTGKIVLTDL